MDHHSEGQRHSFLNSPGCSFQSLLETTVTPSTLCPWPGLCSRALVRCWSGGGWSERLDPSRAGGSWPASGCQGECLTPFNRDVNLHKDSLTALDE
ncbi:hypothetical protein QQF64_003670 [Cirrhinus molitorella]|uniref:Uncharacterized protein n=1 Tax=Cirrhinus molitorella TaxID=172907 RepID=A0ABR3MLY6_9TELE